MNSLTDADRKALTEFLGEKWREPYFSCTCHDGSCPSKMVDENRTFTSGDDMVALFEEIVKRNRLDEFEDFAIRTKNTPQVSMISLPQYLIRPTRFAWLVKEFLKGGDAT